MQHIPRELLLPVFKIFEQVLGKYSIIYFEVYLVSCQTATIELFYEIVDGLKLLPIFANNLHQGCLRGS